MSGILVEIFERGMMEAVRQCRELHKIDEKIMERLKQDKILISDDETKEEEI